MVQQKFISYNNPYIGLEEGIKADMENVEQRVNLHRGHTSICFMILPGIQLKWGRARDKVREDSPNKRSNYIILPLESPQHLYSGQLCCVPFHLIQIFFYYFNKFHV